MSEFLMLEFLKVGSENNMSYNPLKFFSLQEIGMTHMKIIEGLGTLLQLTALLARLCQISERNES
jgi:replication factor C subunit 2/4